jgi:AcrR family transcriptional regulator
MRRNGFVPSVTDTTPEAAVSPTRPRVEGEREEQILEAALVLLCRVGYDRMTMDAIAAEAKAGKATLYRRWSTKSSLVVDAVLRSKEHLQVADPDTGSLRDDLIAMACSHGGLADDRSSRVMSGVITALHHDPEFAEEFRTRVIAPKTAATRALFVRARERGEITADLDLDLFAPALAAIVLHRSFVLGLPADEKTVTQAVDELILPAATRR